MTEPSRRELMIRATGAAAMVPLSLLLDACGGSSSTGRPATSPLTREQYQSAITAVVDSQESRRATDLFQDIVESQAAPAGCTTKVRNFYEDIRTCVQKIADLTPPADAAEAHREFLDGAQESVRLIGTTVDRVASGKATCGDDVRTGVYMLPSTDRAEAAIKKLEGLGYVVFGE